MNNDIAKSLANVVVLIVEDDEVALFGLKQSLIPYCKSVLEAQDGLSALEVYKKHDKIDVILTDINLPHLNAFKMIDEITKINPAQKVIIMTSYPTNDNLHNSFKSDNVCLFLRKPINILDMQSHIAILTKRPQNDQIVHLSPNLYVNQTKQQVFVNNHLVALSGMNKKVFWLLFNNLNQVISYETLQSYLYPNGEGSIYSLRMNIVRLKKLLQENVIINVPDSGYMMKGIESSEV